MFGMIEARENLTLGAEAHAEIGSSRAINYFDGDLSRELSISALAEEHRACTTAAEH